MRAARLVAVSSSLGDDSRQKEHVFEVPDELLRRAKAAAQQSGVSLREYVIAALELATKAERASKYGGGK